MPTLRHLVTSLLLLALSTSAAALTLPATTDQDASLPVMAVKGYRFHAQSFGDSKLPVLIVLHGGPGGDHRYLLGLKALADVRHVVFYDQRGTGLSPRVSAEAISVDAYLADLDAIVDHVSPGHPVDLLGHSWGAMLASAYTGRHPGKVGRLVLAEPGFLDQEGLARATGGGWPGWNVVWGMALAWLSQWTVDAEDDAYARRDHLVGRMLPLFQAGATCDGRIPAMDGWRAGSPAFDATIGRMRSDPGFAVTLSFRDGVDAFSGPVLFMAGQCSAAMGESLQKRHMTYFRDARIQVIQEAGHFMFNDQPGPAMDVVRGFLADR